MPTLPVLLRKLQALHRQSVETEREITDVEKQIVATGKREPKATTRKPRSTHAQVVEVVKATVKVLRDAGKPLPRREIAARLGISSHAAHYRLVKAIELRFVEKAGPTGYYRATNVVPAL